jgi:7,8-dihydropterin-6-yl-methyl-4-(beta-D-ribofuranosyl)aminobenzene 5'-phosphate synthase
MLDIEKIKLTTLSENTVADIHYVAEWGLSVHIAIADSLSILMDTGNGNACTANANAAGIRLSALDMIVLSHGHADHTGGLRAVLQQMRHENPALAAVDVYCHPAAMEPQYVKHSGQYFYRGFPHEIEELKRLGAKFKTATEPQWLTPEIVLSGEVPMLTEFESVAPICFLKKQDRYVPSPVADDQALFIITNSGLIIITGCAHRGIVNTIMHARNITGVEAVHLVIGGTHLLNTAIEQQQKTLQYFEQTAINKVGVSHCTGMQPASFLAARLGPKRFFFNNAGTAISFSGDRTRIRAFENYQD